jgi:hypothetical protein
MRGLVEAVALGTPILLAGCTGMGGDTPTRPPLNVADQVQQVDRGEVVGTWTCRELNPYPELPQQRTTITYNKDGTLVGEGRSEARPPFGAMTVNLTGKWAVEGDRIVTSDMQADAGSADAFTDVMAGIATSIANSWSTSQAQGSGDVLKLTERELVLRPVGVDDPPTFSCSR